MVNEIHLEKLRSSLRADEGVRFAGRLTLTIDVLNDGRVQSWMSMLVCGLERQGDNALRPLPPLLLPAFCVLLPPLLLLPPPWVLLPPPLLLLPFCVPLPPF